MYEILMHEQEDDKNLVRVLKKGTAQVLTIDEDEIDEIEDDELREFLEVNI